VPDVVVDMNSSIGPVTRRGTGLLHAGINPGMDVNLWQPLRGKLFRAPDFDAPDTRRMDRLYPLVRPFNEAEFHFTMCDSVLHIFNASGVWPGDGGGNFGELDNIYDFLVAKYRDKPGGAWDILHDIWNEPNVPFFFPRSQAQYHTVWKHCYDRIRSQRAGALITGPCIATDFSGHNWSTESVWLKAFLTFARDNNCIPDRVSWHENGFSQFTTVSHVNEMRTWMAANLPAVLEIELNEVMANTGSPFVGLRPSEAATYMAAFERAKVRGVCKSNWVSSATDLAGLLTSTVPQQPRSIWWVFLRYAELKGEIMTVTPAQQELDGPVSWDGKTLRAIIGNHTAGALALTLRLQNVPNVLREKDESRRVFYTTQRITSSDEAALPALADPTALHATVSGGEATIPYTLQAWEAVSIIVAAAHPPIEQTYRRHPFNVRFRQ
jgi:hypothetical protein